MINNYKFEYGKKYTATIQTEQGEKTILLDFTHARTVSAIHSIIRRNTRQYSSVQYKTIEESK